jgi:hypothetical protein
MLKQVKVKVGDESINGAMHEDELLIANVIDVGDVINVDGKDREVLSSSVDYRDNVLKINLAKASKLKKEKKSDGKSTKG